MSTTDDWRALVAARGKEAFVAAYAYPFLLALSGLDAPQGPARTIRMEGGPELINAIMAERRRMQAEGRDKGPVVLPVRKVQTTFPSMITVGRAKNNDIIVPDALVSKFHAFFRQLDDGEWALADAGSANGTQASATSTSCPRASPSACGPGDRITFGGVSAFRFLDPGGLWAALHDPTR